MEIPAPQTGSGSSPAAVSGASALAATSTVARTDAGSTSVTLSAYVQSSQAVPASTPPAAAAPSANTYSQNAASPVPASTPTPGAPSPGAPAATVPNAAMPAATVPAATVSATTMPAATMPPATMPPAQANTPEAGIATPSLSGSRPAASAAPSQAQGGNAGYLLDLLVNTTRNTAAVASVTAMTDQTLKLLAQGQVVRMLAQSPVAVAPGSILQLQWTRGTGMHIAGITPPTELPPNIRSFVGKAMAGQGSPGPLLQSLQTLLSDTNTKSVLPGGIRDIGSQLLALLPDQTTITQPGVLERFVARSGLFMESAFAEAARAPGEMQDPAPDGADSGSGEGDVTASAGDTRSGKALVRMLGQLRDQLLGASAETRKGEANSASENPMETVTGKGAARTPSGDVTQDDFKALLLRLQQQLNTTKALAPATQSAAASLGISTEESASTPATGNPSGAISHSLASASTLPPSSALPSSSSLPFSPPPPSPALTSDLPSTPELPVAAEAGADDMPVVGGVTGGKNSVTLDAKIGDARIGDAKTGDGKSNAMPENLKGDKNTEAQSGNTEEPIDAAAADARRNQPAAARLARAAGQYQRLEQLTRPATAQPPATSVMTDAHEQLTNDLQYWAELVGDIEVPGLGLPLPHRDRNRTTQTGDALDNLLELLLKRTQESLNRLHLHQLGHSGATTRESGAQQQNPPLTFDLPVFFDGKVQVFNTRIDEEELPAGGEDNPDKKIRQWSVSLGFDIDGLGPMFCQLKMTEHHANLQFWADRPATLSLTRANLDFLSRSLHELGVAVSEVSCHEGLPKQTRTRLSQQLVDINT